MKDKQIITQLKSALTYLVDLKAHKDLKGKDEFYVAHQQKAWNKAKAILSEPAVKNNTSEANLPIKRVSLSLPLKDNYSYLRGLADGIAIKEPMPKDDFPDEFESYNDVMERIWEIENNEG